MLVRERMSHPVITVHPELPIMEALSLMAQENIRRLPVVDDRGRLLGIVTKEDLLHAAPSDATSLDIWEINYLVSKITVKRVMAEDVITVAGDTPLEEAARIMADNKVGGLPVMADGGVVGMITETDLFKVFLEMLGAREKGIRLAALVPNKKGVLARITGAISEIGGNILALGTFLGENSENRELTFKIEGVEKGALQNAIQPLVEKIVDIRE